MAVTQTIQDQVTELYVGFFGRAPDAVGMGYWAEKLGAGTATVYSIANEFSKTPEFISNYGGLTPTQQVGRIYQNVLNRAPDAQGEAYWVAQLGAGTPIGTVVYNIVNAAFQQVGTADGLLVQNKVTVGEYFALVLASNDTAVAKTAYVGVTSVASSVVAAEAALAQAVAPSYSLTTNIDTVPANGTLPAYAKVDGIINGGVNDTFQTGDTINGTAGLTNTVNVTVAATNGAAPLVAISNVSNVAVRALAAQTINANLFNGVSNVGSNNSSAVVTVTNGELAASYNVANAVTTTNGGIIAGLRAGQTGGTADVQKFSVVSSGTAGNVATGLAAVNTTVTGATAGVEGYSLATTGANFITFTGTVGAGSTTDAKTLTITGAGVNSITVAGLNTTSTIDASATTGATTLVVGTGLTTGDTVKGGTATTDVLRATISGSVATGLNVTGIETFRSESGAAATLAFTTNPGFTNVRVDDAATAGANGVHTLSNGGGFANLNYVGTGSNAAAGNAMTFSGINATGGWTGAGDALAINFANGAVALTNAAAYTVTNAITVNGVENVTVNVADASNTAVTALNGINSSTLTSVSFVSNGSVTAGALDTLTNTTNSIASVDFSGVTGNAVSTVAIGGVNTNIMAAASQITAGVGGLTATVNQAEAATDVLTFTGAAGVDSLIAATYLGNVVANTGASGDTITLGAEASSQITGGAGADAITLAAAGGLDTLIYTAANQGAAAVAANSAVVQAAGTGDTVAAFQTGAAGDVINFNAATTGATHAAVVGGVLNALNTTATGTVYANTGTYIAAAALTGAAVAAAVGTVTMALGDSAIVLIETANNSGVWNVMQVTAGTAHAGTALGATDTVSLVGTYTSAVAATDFVVANFIA